MRPIAGFFSLLKKYPLLANSVTVGSIFVAGDVSQQTIAGVKRYDWTNTCNIGLFCGTVFGPAYFYWYRFLNARFPGKALQVIGQKIVIDQLVMGGIGTAGFFVGLSLVEGKEDIFAELIEKGPKAYLLNTLFWPPAQYFNFRFNDPRFHAIYVASCDFVWTNILCFIKSQKSKYALP